MNIKTKNIKTWENKEGNLCFSYNMRQPMEKPIIILVIGVCMACILLAEYLYLTTTYSLIPLIFIFIPIFIYWCFYPCKDNEAVEKIMMNKNINVSLDDELIKFGNDVYEIKRKFLQDSKGTYGIITGTYMLVLLSNNVILEYELIFHKETEATRAYHEFIKKPIECINSKHKKAIEIRRFSKWLTNIALPEKSKLTLIIFIFLGLGISLLSLYLWLIIKLEYKAVIFPIGYIVLFMILNPRIAKSKNRILKALDFVISLPITIAMILGDLMFPTITILTSYMCLGIYAFILPMITFKSLSFILCLNISWETTLFITLIFGSILSVHGSKLIHWIIKEHSPLKNWENHKYEALKTELALYVINKNNVNFLIYLVYFLYLSISGFMQIEYNKPLITTNIDSIILKAFLIFIAFSNMRNKSKDVEIEPKSLLEKMIRLITTHDEK